MRVVAFSDTHFHDFTAYAKINDDGINSRLQEQINFLDFLQNVLDKEKPDVVLFTGDLLHTKGLVKPSVLVPILKRFKYMLSDYKTLMIPGNHDMEDFWGKCNVIQFMNLVSNNCYIASDKPELVEVDGKNFLLVPYRKNKDDFFDILISFKGKFDVLLSHQGLVQKKAFDRNDIFVNELQELIGNNVYVFNGHYHVPFVQDNIFNIGACIKKDFTDVGRDNFVWALNLFEKNQDIVKYQFDEIDFIDFYFPEDKDKIDVTDKYVRCFVEKQQTYNAKQFLDKYARGYELNFKKHQTQNNIKKNTFVDLADVIKGIIKDNYTDRPKLRDSMLDLFDKISKENI